MKKILLLLLSSPIVVLAAGTTSPAKPAAAAPVATKAEALKKAEEKKHEVTKETTFVQDLTELYKNTENARTEIKKNFAKYYNQTTSSPYFQIGKCTVAGLLVYYGVEQLKSFTRPQAVSDDLMRLVAHNPFAEQQSKSLLSFLRNRQNFIAWTKDPVTKASVKIIVGNLLLTKQIMEGVGLYQKAVKRFL